MTKVNWQKVESLFVCMHEVATAICNCMFWLGLGSSTLTLSSETPI